MDFPLEETKDKCVYLNTDCLSESTFGSKLLYDKYFKYLRQKTETIKSIDFPILYIKKNDNDVKDNAF